MRKLLFISILLTSLPVWAATHTASVSFTASADSTTSTPGTTSIYWANGACPASGISGLTWNLATSAGQPSYSAVNPYVLNLPSAGTYCVYTTATIGGATSVPSNTAGGTATPFPPTAVTIVVQ